MTAIGARAVKAAAALLPLGLNLLVSQDEFVVTPDPGDPAKAVLTCQSIEQVEEFIADHRPTAAVRQVEAASTCIATAYGDPPGTVSSGSSTMTLEYREPAPIKPRTPRVGDPVHYVSHGSPVRADGSQAYTSECRAAIVTAGPVLMPGTFGTPGGEGLSLCVLNPTGQFFSQGIRHDPGTFTGPEREATPGEPLPLITCDDLTFEGGTWHWAGHA